MKSKKELNQLYMNRYKQEHPDLDIFSKELAYSDGFNQGYATSRTQILEYIKKLNPTVFGNVSKEEIIYEIERIGL